MAHDKNISPVGWYYGSYLQRFVELEDEDRDDPEKRFTSWENTVLVEAESLESAYARIEEIAKQNSKPYRGGADGVPVQWEYLGITEVLPVYEKICDGAEIAWTERPPRKLKNLKRWIKPKHSIHR